MAKDNITPRGRTFVGTIIKAKAPQTATLQFERRKYIPKYERYLRTTTRLTVHNPDSIGARPGDIVKVQETRPISKTKSFIIIEKMGKDRRFLEEEEFQEDIKKETGVPEQNKEAEKR